MRWGLDSLIRPQVRKLAKKVVEEGGIVVVAHGRGLGGIRPFLGVCGCAGLSWSQFVRGGRGGVRGVRWNGVWNRGRGVGGDDPSRVLPSDSVQGSQGMQDAWACRRGGMTVWHLTLWDVSNLGVFLAATELNLA